MTKTGDDDMRMIVLHSGPMTTIQDEGRFGYMASGIGQAGAMDQDSYNEANALVGNESGEAVLEATLLGPTLLFESDALLAYAGADMQARIGDISMERGRAYKVFAGQTVSFGMAKNGVRGYIAAAGGFDVPKVMGSRSTDIKCKIGGYEGRKLLDGDILNIPDLHLTDGEIKDIGARSITPRIYGDELTVRVILGPQDDYFTEEGIQTFFRAKYKVLLDSDRMGIRLDGDKIQGKGSMDIFSDGIAFGSIQVTSAGLPIILMADHQTTGGYAKIGTVISADLPLLAQAAPGTKIHFKKVDIKDVQMGAVRKAFSRIMGRGKAS